MRTRAVVVLLTMAAGAGGVALAVPAQAHLTGPSCRPISQAPGHSYALEVEADYEGPAQWGCLYTPASLTQTYVADAPTGWRIYAVTSTTSRVVASGGATPATGTFTLQPGEKVEIQVQYTCTKTPIPRVTIPGTTESIDGTSCDHGGFITAGS
jgi:hypothetical protein